MRKKRVRNIILVVSITALGGLGLIGLFFGLRTKNQELKSTSAFVKSQPGSGWDYHTSTTTGLNTSLKAGMVEVTMDDASVNFQLPFADQSIVQEAKTIVLAGSNPAIKTVYAAEPERIKESIVLSQAPLSNQFIFPLTTKNLDIYLTPDNLPVFYDSRTREYRFHIEPPFAVDANGMRMEAVHYHLEEVGNAPHSIAYPTTSSSQVILGKPLKVSQSNRQYQLVMEIDSNWLKTATYPVTIDPTVTHNTQTLFATGQLNRIKDVGVGDTAPQLESYYQELGADIYTVGLWHMNEGVRATCSGGQDLCDSSGNGLHATFNGSAAFSTTRQLGAYGMTLNGSGSWAEIPSTTLFNFGTGDFTVEWWAKANSFSSYNTYISLGAWGNTILLRQDNSTTFDFCIMGGCTTMAFTPPLNLWYHMAVVRQGTVLSLYYNGQFFNSITNSSNISLSGVTRIGTSSHSNTENFNGYLDEVRVSNIARSPDEIKADASRRPYAVYTSPVLDLGTSLGGWNSLSWNTAGLTTGNGEVASNSAGLVAQWNLNETSGTTASTAAGSCGSTCNGTLLNFSNTTGQDVVPLSGWTSVNRRWGAGALMTNGSNNVVSVANTAALQITGALTLEAWVKTTNLPAYAGFIGKMTGSYGYALRTETNGYAEFGVSGNGSAYTAVAGKTRVNDGNWHHLVGMYVPSTSLSIYVDGQLQNTNTTSIPASINNTASNLVLGCTYSTPSECITTTLDAVKIYNRTLTPAEIISNYNAANVEFQTRTSADGISWEMWKPTTSETVLDNMDNSTAWTIPSLAISTGVQLATASSTIIKAEGTGSTRMTTGTLQVDANTIGLWHLDETGGTGAYLKDSSTNNNHLTPTNTTVVNGIVGKARSMNGSTDYAAVSSAPTTSLTNWSMEAWINPTSLNQNGMVVYNGNDTGGYGFGITNGSGGTGGKLTVLFGTIAWFDCGYTFPAVGTWYHVAITRDTTTTRCYVNGAQTANTSATNPNPVTANFSIGMEYSTTNTVTHYFFGTIDEVRFSNITRTSEEIAEAYRMGRDHRIIRSLAATDLSTATHLPFYVASDRKGTLLSATIGESAFANYEADANTVGLWHLEEQSGSGAYLKDSSGNGNHATPTGTTYTLGKIGKARSFNGSSDYINVGTTLNPCANNACTMSAWIMPRSVSAGNGFIFVKGNDFLANSYGIAIYNQTIFTMTYMSGYVSANSGNLLQANNWYYVTGVISGSNIATYLNGQLVGTGTFSGTLPSSNTNTVWIGSQNRASYQYPFQGIIDEVRVDNIVRSADDIRQAYEVGRRSHQVTIDFKAKLDSGNLIADSSDTSFTVDETAYGAFLKAGNLFVGDKVIVKENYNGTEYLAQGSVSTVNSSTGAVTVSAWDTGSTVPSVGFSVNAIVFKWQREYMDVTGSLPTHRDAITRLTLRLLDGSQGGNIWLDDFRYTTPYLNTPGGSTITSTLNRYFQYRTIFSASDTNVSAGLNSVMLNYAPALSIPGNCRIVESKPSSMTLQWTDTNSSEDGYDIQRNVDGAGFISLTTTVANATSYADTTVTAGHTYAYQIRPFIAGSPNTYGSGCVTSTLNNRTGDFKFSGLKMQGLQLK